MNGVFIVTALCGNTDLPVCRLFDGHVFTVYKIDLTPAGRYIFPVSLQCPNIGLLRQVAVFKADLVMSVSVRIDTAVILNGNTTPRNGGHGRIPTVYSIGFCSVSNS